MLPGCQAEERSVYTRAVPLRLPRSGAGGCLLRLVEHEAQERRVSPATWSVGGVLGDAIQSIQITMAQPQDRSHNNETP